MLNRRHLFGAVPAVAVAAVPARAEAAAPDPWDVLIAGLAVMDPVFAQQARDARDQGFETDQLYMICRTMDSPFLLFRKTVDGINGPHIFETKPRDGGLN